MITNIDNVLLVKYLRKELDEDETQLVVDWLEAKDENKHFLFGLKEAYMLSRWEELSAIAGTEKGWNGLKKSLDKKQPAFIKRYTPVVLRYAAVVIVLLTSGFFLHNLVHRQQPQYFVMETASGQQSTLTLNDGTIVKLNENSKGCSVSSGLYFVFASKIRWLLSEKLFVISS